MTGFEPARVASLEPESSVYAVSPHLLNIDIIAYFLIRVHNKATKKFRIFGTFISQFIDF